MDYPEKIDKSTINDDTTIHEWHKPTDLDYMYFGQLDKLTKTPFGRGVVISLLSGFVYIANRNKDG